MLIFKRKFLKCICSKLADFLCENHIGQAQSFWLINAKNRRPERAPLGTK